MSRSVLAHACGVIALILAGPALAQGGCAGFKWPVDRELAAFAAADLPVLTGGAALAGVAQGTTLKLAPQDGLSFAVAPTHKPKSNPAYGGAFALPPVAAAGPYQVTISDDAWIDVVQNGKLLKQTGFTGVKDCPSVRKSVKFDLAAGPATVMITDAASDILKIDVLPPVP